MEMEHCEGVLKRSEGRVAPLEEVRFASSNLELLVSVLRRLLFNVERREIRNSAFFQKPGDIVMKKMPWFYSK